LTESLEIFNKLKDRKGTVYVLEFFAGIAASLSQVERTACLCGAASAIRQKDGLPQSKEEKRNYERRINPVKERSNKEVWESAWKRGEEMTLEQVINSSLIESA
jgi:homoaconitase/3-isopropylmalate dehydratase large subunit